MSAPTPVGLRCSDAPERWGALGFAIDADGRVRIGALSITFAPGATGWTLSVEGATAQPESVDGVPTAWAAMGVQVGQPVAHPNGVLSVDHIVVLTPDRERTVAALEAVGMQLRREREAGSMRQAFFRHGEAIVEVVQPVGREPAEADGPARLWGLTLVVEDLDQTASLLGPLLGPVSDAVQSGRRIATVRREAGLGTALALMS
jgi:hypothetical protein